MVGNESNGIIANGQSPLRRDSNKINALKLENVNNELAQYYSLNEKISRSNSEASTQVVKFQGIDDKDSICSEKEKKLPPIPDGGWGWVVVIAAFLTSACSDGLAYSFGILHEEFINYFGESQAKTSWIGSLFIAVPLISGPIMSALVDQFGCRTMTMIASIVSTGGFLLAAISNSVELLCVTLGIVSGLAMGILYVTSVVSVAFWFDKRRTLAVSLASCGIGFGTVIYSPLTTFLLQIYDWRNTLIILSGTILNMCVCGALMRDPDWVIIKDKREEKRKKKKKEKKLRKCSSVGSISVRSAGGESVVLSVNEIGDLVKSGHDPEYILSILSANLAESEELEATTQMNAELTHKRNNSTVEIPTFLQQNEQVPPEVMENIMSNKNLSNIIEQNYSHLITRSEPYLDLYDLSNKDFNNTQHPETSRTVSLKSLRSNDGERSNNKEVVNVNESKKQGDKMIETRDVNNNIVLEVVPHITSKDSQHSISRDVPEYRNTVKQPGYRINAPKFRVRALSLPDIYKTSTRTLRSKSDDEKKWYNSVLKVLKKNFDFTMFTELHFLMLNVTSVLMSLWSIIPFFFLKSYMSDRDVEGGALVLSMIGVASGVGIVALGWFGDKPWYNVTKAYAICLIICGISVAAYPFVITNYGLLIFVSVIFGVSFASSYSYTPAILIELVPIDYFTMGYGMVLLSQGIGNLVGPPIGGLLFDLSESWDLTFYVGGVWLVISGLCVGVIPFTKNRRIFGKQPLLLDIAEKEKVTGSDSV